MASLHSNCKPIYYLWNIIVHIVIQTLAPFNFNKEVSSTNKTTSCSIPSTRLGELNYYFKFLSSIVFKQNLSLDVTWYPIKKISLQIPIQAGNCFTRHHTDLTYTDRYFLSDVCFILRHFQCTYRTSSVRARANSSVKKSKPPFVYLYMGIEYYIFESLSPGIVRI